MKARDLVPTCKCRHAQQLHRAPQATACNGNCWRHDPHNADDHRAECSVSRCICDHFQERAS